MFGSKLATKMWETAAEKGIGGLFKPWQMRREGNISIELKRKEMLIIAQTEKDIEGIKKGEVIVSLTDINNPKLISMNAADTFNFEDNKEPYLDIKSLILSANNYTIASEIQKEINVTKALLAAEEELLTDQSEPVKDNIEDDWLNRWRDSAATTNSQQLQSLWGKVLAGELKSPGRYSLRTLEFIRNLTQREAADIEKLFAFVFHNRIIKNTISSEPSTTGYLNGKLDFNFLLQMQSLGIINGVESIGLTSTFPSVNNERFVQYFLYNQKVLCPTHEDHSKSIEFKVYLLTTLGMEIYSLSNVLIDSEYLNNIIEVIKAQGFTVIIGDVITNKDGARETKNLVEV